jgi:hypothetical protein
MEIVVGRPYVSPSTPSHTFGVREGNEPKGIFAALGWRRAARFLQEARHRRSTGINPKARAPIDPRMPTLTPP